MNKYELYLEIVDGIKKLKKDIDAMNKSLNELYRETMTRKT